MNVIEHEIDTYLSDEAHEEAMEEARIESEKEELIEFMEYRCNWDGTFCVIAEISMLSVYKKIEVLDYSDLKVKGISTDQVIKFNNNILDAEYFNIHKSDVFDLVFERGFTFECDGSSFSKD